MIQVIIGIWSVIGLAVLAIMALIITPPDVIQGESVRFIYIHPATSLMMYISVGVCALASILYLIPRTKNLAWDYLAGAAGSIGLVFCGLSLVTGSIWGRLTWGVWWTWDWRLTSTAILAVLLAGYVALRKTNSDINERAKTSAVVAIIAAIDIPIIHFSVQWWRTLHQGTTLSITPKIEGIQLTTMLFSFAVFGLVFIWMLMQRYQSEKQKSHLETELLNAALLDRQQQ